MPADLKAAIAAMVKNCCGAKASMTMEQGHRCYRGMLLMVLNDVPRGKLPQDLAALGILVQACELSAYALFLLRGKNHAQVGFLGEGIDDLMDWLAQCQAFFAHVAYILPDMSDKGTDAAAVRRMAIATALEISELAEKIRDSGETNNEEDGDDEAGQWDDEASPLFLAPTTLGTIVGRFSDIIRNWVDAVTYDELNARFGEGVQELFHWRQLMEGESATGEQGA